MAFYGLLVAVSAIFSAILLSHAAYQASQLQGYSSSYALYSNLLQMEAFGVAFRNTMPENSTQFGQWISSMQACARIDNLNLSVNGSVAVISTRSGPALHSVINIKN